LNVEGSWPWSIARFCRRHLIDNHARHPPVFIPFHQLHKLSDLSLFFDLILIVMAEFGVAIPPGQSAPFATVTPTDHSAWIIISTALGLSMSLLFAAIRVFIRSATKHEYGKDDYVLAAATVCYYIFADARVSRPLTLPSATGKRTVHCALKLMRRWSWKVKDPP
jgi:hypothetical protein